MKVRAWRPESWLTAATGLALSLVGTAAAEALRVAVVPHLGQLLLWPVIAASAVRGGMLPGAGSLVLALGLETLLTAHSDANWGNAAGLLTFGVIVFAIATSRWTWRERALKAEQAGLESDRRARGLAREVELLTEPTHRLATFLLDREGQVARWSAAAERLTGWSEDAMLHRPEASLYLFEPGQADDPAGDLARVQADGRYLRERVVRRHDGTSFVAQVTTVALRDADGELTGFAEVVHDIAAERASELALRACQIQLRSILATVPDAMVIINENGVLISFNAAAEAMFGYSEGEVVGRNVSILMPSPDREQHDRYLEKYLRTGQQWVLGTNRRLLAMSRDGVTFPVELFVGEAVVDGQRMFTGFMRDLRPDDAAYARLQEVQNELFHASRLSAIGALGTAIAHELNQPLAAIVNWVDTTHRQIAELESSDPRLEEPLLALEEAATEAMRASAIVSSLREFIARGDGGKLLEQLPALIGDAILLGLRDLRRDQIRVVFDPESFGSCPVLVNRVQVQQVLINLFRNAVEAMGERGGELRIAIRCAGQFAEVVVSDTGPGLPSDLEDDLFGTFVSTKPHGVGLGLSICRTIVEAHGGRIWVDNIPGGGAEFHFTLPRAQPTEEEAGS